MLSSAILMPKDLSPATPEQLPVFQNWMTVLYGLIATALWHSPIYGWLLLVSAWARRATFLWAVFPLLAVSALERMALGTTRFMAMLQYRMVGAMSEAFVSPPQHGSHGLMTHLTQIIGEILTRPGLGVSRSPRFPGRRGAAPPLPGTDLTLPAPLHLSHKENEMSTDYSSGTIAGASPLGKARAAGACWLLVIVTGALAMVGGGELAVASNLAATAFYVAATVLVYQRSSRVNAGLSFDRGDLQFLRIAASESSEAS